MIDDQICPLCKSRQCKLEMGSKAIVKLRILSKTTVESKINHFNELPTIVTKKLFVIVSVFRVINYTKLYLLI